MFQVTRTMGFSDVVKLLKELAELNYHTEAVGVLAQCWGSLADQAEIRALTEDHIEHGFMTDVMIKRRNRVRNSAMADAARFGRLTDCDLRLLQGLV
jgi:hypothetical protein